MHEEGKKILRLMFKENETICVSNSKYGYHSIPLANAINGPVVLVPPEHSIVKMGKTIEEAIEHIDTDQIILCALNPIKGFREDANCTAYRNFLVELDSGPIDQQLAYIKKINMPFSAAIFSANKSLHFLISLDKDLPSEKVFRVFSEWILKAVTLADPATKNPSRSIRVPGAYREPGKKQTTVEYHGVIKIEDLVAWLNLHPEAKPQEKQRRVVSEKPDFDKIKPWACKKLIDASKLLISNRNRTWYALSIEFTLAGYSEDEVISILERYFVEERDFTKREWLTAVKSGIKTAFNRT
jgi:hypothetical protein